jgi:chromosome segregation ATPase
VSEIKKQTSKELQAEISRLDGELQMRDQLVHQLSAELFRLVKGNNNFLPSAETSDRDRSQVQNLREQLQEVEQQVAFYQEQIAQKDAENYQLRHSVQELTDRSQMLEQVVQELPEVYRQKFSDRLGDVMEQVEMLQRENRQLHAELQSVSYRLAMRNRRSNGLDLPSFGQRTPGASVDMPSFGNA